MAGVLSDDNDDDDLSESDRPKSATKKPVAVTDETKKAEDTKTSGLGRVILVLIISEIIPADV